jgi:DNA gyrase/topoisomerase IV subunit A
MGLPRKPIPAIKLLDGDEIISVVLEDDDTTDYIIVTDHGYALRYPSNLVSPIGRFSQGVTAISDKAGAPIGLLVCDSDSKKQLCLVTGGGLAKRINLKDIPQQKGRAGRGVDVLRSALTRLVSALLVSTSDQIQLELSDGSIENKKATDFHLSNRAARGKMIVSLVRGQRVNNAKII